MDNAFVIQISRTDSNRTHVFGGNAPPLSSSDEKRVVLKGEGLEKAPFVYGVSLSVALGEIVGLFGANGAGKTSTFLMLAGLLLPERGKVCLMGQEVTQWPLYRRGRLGLRYLPQNSSLFPSLTVAENLLAFLELTELSAPSRQLFLAKLLSDFRLESIAKTPGYALSGGERRRVEIARTLIGNPSVLLLDEPLAGIDPSAVEDIMMLLKILAKTNIGILITDHNVRDVLNIADRVYVLHHGTILAHGSPEVIVSNTEVREKYLGKSFS